MNVKNPTVKNQLSTEPYRFNKRIGSSLYKVSVYFSQESKETLSDKILRLAKNELNQMPKCAIIKELQTERLHDGSVAS